MKRPRQLKRTKHPEQPPMVFEHAPVEQRPYDRIAARVLAAVEELNETLKEAHECAEMRVFIGASKADGESMRFQPQIYNLTHSTLTYRIQIDEDSAGKKMAWRHIKDPAFKDAAGQGLDAVRKKKNEPRPPEAR